MPVLTCVRLFYLLTMDAKVWIRRSYLFGFPRARFVTWFPIVENCPDAQHRTWDGLGSSTIVFHTEPIRVLVVFRMANIFSILSWL